MVVYKLGQLYGLLVIGICSHHHACDSFVLFRSPPNISVLCLNIGATKGIHNQLS